MRSARTILIWAILVAAIAVPIAAVAMSPLLAWRQPIHIAAGFAGVVALGLMLIQPLLIGGYLPGLSPNLGRHLHRWIGGLLVLSVAIHVGGLWTASPPEVIDALLFVSPTPFSDWGVIAMWAVFATALLAALRRRLRIHPRTWRSVHSFLAVVIVAGSVVHGMLVEGAMETVSKVALCVLVLVATMKVLIDLRVWARRTTPR